MKYRHLHSFWTRPIQSRAGWGPGSLIEFCDFEALTWLVSALEGRRHGGIRLVTDTRGLEFVRRVGLDGVYDGGIATELDGMPEAVNPKVFWAAGKLQALLGVEGPCIALDTDAVLWDPPAIGSELLALHAEDRRWSWYATGQEVFRSVGFTDSGWDWDADPVNAGIVCYPDAGFARRYAERVMRFMVEFSGRLASEDAAAEDLREGGCDSMIFAEQRILALCARREGLKMGYLGQLHPSAAHMARNDRCMHLWGSKDMYRQCPEARVALVNHLIGYVQERHPDARPILERWRLAEPLTEPAVLGGEAAEAVPAEKMCLLRDVRGIVWIEDSNVRVRRRAVEGGRVWVAEAIWPEPGASFRLCLPEGGTVRVGQEPGGPRG